MNTVIQNNLLSEYNRTYFSYVSENSYKFSFIILLAIFFLALSSFATPSRVLLPMELEKGWNFFSSPGTPLNTDLPTFFEGQLDGPLWEYKDGSYRETTRIESGKGYAVFLREGVTLHYLCEPEDMDIDNLVPLQTGLNLIGPYSPVPIPTDDKSEVSGFDGNTGTYQAITGELLVGKAYWLSVDTPKKLLLGSTKADSDNDQLPDYWEQLWGFDYQSPDADQDPDRDTLQNLAEFQTATNPLNPDTDGDGLPDHSDLDPLSQSDSSSADSVLTNNKLEIEASNPSHLKATDSLRLINNSEDSGTELLVADTAVVATNVVPPTPESKNLKGSSISPETDTLAISQNDGENIFEISSAIVAPTKGEQISTPLSPPSHGIFVPGPWRPTPVGEGTKPRLNFPEENVSIPGTDNEGEQISTPLSPPSDGIFVPGPWRPTPVGEGTEPRLNFPEGTDPIPGADGTNDGTTEHEPEEENPGSSNEPTTPPGGPSYPPEEPPDEEGGLCCGFVIVKDESGRNSESGDSLGKAPVISYPETTDPLEFKGTQESRQNPAIGGYNALLHSGTFVETKTDLHVDGILPFMFTRNYRSNIKIDQGGLIGFNWDFSMNKRIVPVPIKRGPYGLFLEYLGVDKPQITYYNGTGRKDTYEHLSGEWRTVLNFGKRFKAYVTTYKSPPDAFHVIQRYVLSDSDDHPFASHPDVDDIHREAIFYVLREKHGSQLIFNCRGQMIYSMDRNDNRMTFVYNGPWNPLTKNKVLSEITDNAKRGYTIETLERGEAMLFTNYECRPIGGQIPIPRISKITDFDGRSVTFEYDKTAPGAILKKVVQDFGPDRLITQYTYEAQDQQQLLTSITAPRESNNGGGPYLVNEYKRNASGIYALIKQSLGQDEFSIKIGHGLTTVTDPNKNTIEYTLETKPSGPVVKQAKITGAIGEDRGPWITKYTCNEAGLIESVEFPEGNKVQYTFDKSNNSVTEGPIRNWVEKGVTYVNNLAKYNLLKITRFSNVKGDPYSSKSIAFKYESLFNQLSESKDALQNITTYNYDYFKGPGYNGNPIKQILPTLTRPGESPLSDLFYEYTYNSDGLRNSIIDTDKNKTEYKFKEETNYLLSITDANKAKWGFKPDLRGNIIETKTPEGMVTQNEYDKRDLLKKKIVDSSGYKNTETYDYDENGNLKNVEVEVKDNFNPDKNGKTAPKERKDTALVTTYEYDIRNRLTETTVIGDQFSRWEKREYDGNSNLKQLTTPSPTGQDKVNTDYQYDGRNKVVSVTEAVGTKDVRTTTMEYDGNGNLIRIEAPENQITDNEYDGYDRLIGITDPMGGYREYTLDLNDNILQETFTGLTGDPNGKGDVLYKADQTYDELNHLITSKVALLDGTSKAQDTKWIYNRALRVERVLGPANHKTTYTYDAFGRVREEIDALGNKTITGYNKDGHLTEFKQVDLELVYDPVMKKQTSKTETYITSFEVDALGRQIKGNMPGGHTKLSANLSITRQITRSNPKIPMAQLSQHSSMISINRPLFRPNMPNFLI